MFTDDPCQSSPPGNNLTCSLEPFPGDLLVAEIFPRLANARTVIRCSAVSKHWHSLLTAPEFLPAFLRRRPPATYVTFVEFRLVHFSMPGTRQLCPSALIIDDGPPDVVAAGATSDYKLFAANAGETDTVLESSCEEFLLLSRIAIGENGIAERHLYIRNAATGLGRELPKLPVEDIHGCAALSIGSLDNEAVITFRVVYHYRRLTLDRIIVFCSESGRWSYNYVFPLPRTGMLHGVVASGGALFWLAGNEQYFRGRIVVFNPFNGSRAILFMPAELMRLEILYHGSAVEFEDAGVVSFLKPRRPHVGVVKGQVRLGHLFRTGARGEYYIKIWELIDPSGTYTPRYIIWSFVNEVKVSDPPAEGNERLYLFSFHPDDGDIVFLCCGCDVYKYCLSKGEYERVFELLCAKGQADERVKDWLPQSAHAFTVKIPPWSVPRLPSSHGLV